jgi:hypothetical protein
MTIAHLSESHIQSITYKVLRAQGNASKCLKCWPCLAMYSHNYSHIIRRSSSEGYEIFSKRNFSELAGVVA